MKKAIILILIVMLTVNFTINCYASSEYVFETKKVQVAESAEQNDMSMFTNDGILYLPLRAVCESLDFDIQWIEEGKIKIDTGFDWFENEKPSYNVNEITAIKLADVVLNDYLGNENVYNSCVFIDENEQSYTVSASSYEYELDDNGNFLRYEGKNKFAVKISKNNGHIMNIIKLPETINLSEDRIPKGFEDTYEMEVDGTFQKEDVITVNDRIYLPAWKLQLLLNVNIEVSNETINIKKPMINLSKETLVEMAYVYSESSDTIASKMKDSIPVITDDDGEDIGIVWLKIAVDKSEAMGNVYASGSGCSVRLNTKDGGLLEYWFKTTLKEQN